MIPKRRKINRIYLINRDFQLRYTRLALLVGAGSTVLTVVLILYPLFQFRILRFPMFVPPPFIAAIAAASILNFALVAWMGILITHRIAGPMFSLVRQIRKLQTGNFHGEFRIRTGDDLKYLVRNFNDLLDFLVRLTQQDRERLDVIVAKVEAARSESPGSSTLAELQALAGELRGSVAARLEPPRRADGESKSETA
jgi:methyl-accepting chemotaxis protein